MPRWTRFVALELARFIGLVILVALISCLMAKMVTDSTAEEFFRNVHLDRDGRPIWEPFLYSCKVSLPIVAVSFVALLLGSIAIAAIGEIPRLGWVRVLVLLVSAIPSFLLPFLFYLLQPWRPFGGFADGGILVPGICLAIGDCNLSAVASQLRESLRTRRNQPYLRTLESLGRPSWPEVWPRACVTLISSLAGRIPHLFGGLVALEWLFNINGIGIAAYRAVVSTPANLHWFLWVCALCVCLRSILRLIELAAKWFLMPETFRTAQQGSTEEDEFSESDMSPSAIRFQEQDTSAAAMAQLSLDELEDVPTTTDAVDGPTGRRNALFRNFRYYICVKPFHWVNVALAVVVVAAFLTILIGCLAYGEAEITGSFEDPSDDHWFGTDLAGIDLVSSARQGIGQQIVPGLATMLCGLIAMPAALLALHRWLSSGRLQRLVIFADHACLYLAEFVESLPKLLVLLAAFSALPGGVVTGSVLGIPVTVNTMVIRLFALIGLLHAPQVYRSVRDELAGLNQSVFIEASLLTGVRWKELLFGIILRNHCLHIILIQMAIIAAGALHYDAVLGLFGVRGRGVIFTWGSTLGIAVEAYTQYAFLDWFNRWVLVVPLVIVWVGITSCWIVAESIKILWGGYVYRLR